MDARHATAGALLALILSACGSGTSRGVGDEGIDETPVPPVPSNDGPPLLGSLGSGTGSTRDEGVSTDPFAVSAMFFAGAGNGTDLAGSIDASGLPTGADGPIAGLAFAPPGTWPPADAPADGALPIPSTIVATTYAGAFDPSADAALPWTADWTVALDGSIARWRFFGRGLAPETTIGFEFAPTPDGLCPIGTTHSGTFSERIGLLDDDETSLTYQSFGDYDICRLPARFTGTSSTGGPHPFLTNDNVYELDDSADDGIPGTIVGTGDGDRGTRRAPAQVVLGIEAGTLVFGRPGEALIVSRGSRIEARGTATVPIVLTSLQQLRARFDGDFDTPAAGEPGGWSGLVVAGRARDARCVSFEACDVPDASTGHFGGDDDAESSGELRHVILRSAGAPMPGSADASPALRLLATGRGTVIDRVQAHGGSGDGVEIEGGSAFLAHWVSSDMRGAGLHARSGWTGGAQHGLIVQGPSSAGRGIEVDATRRAPITFPLLANVTVLGPARAVADASRQALLLDGGTRAQVWNTILTGDFPGGCLDLDDGATFARAGEAGGTAPGDPGPHLFLRNTLADCQDVNFNENG